MFKYFIDIAYTEDVDWCREPRQAGAKYMCGVCSKNTKACGAMDLWAAVRKDAGYYGDHDWQQNCGAKLGAL